MSEAFDLDAYLERIGYGGERAPSLDALAGVAGRHAEAIPFENLDPLLGRPVRLDLASLQRKLVQSRRGGYCFEHNLLLQSALEAMGFHTVGLGARVMWNGTPDTVTPRTHMALLVGVEGERFVVDAGFGGQTLTAPMRLEVDVAQPTPHGRFRLLAGTTGSDFFQEVELAGQWHPTYWFDLVPHYRVDYEVANHFTATHPGSHFTSTISAARTTAEGRWALRGRDLTFYGLDRTVTRRTLASADDLREALADVLLIDVPDDADLDALFERLPVG